MKRTYLLFLVAAVTLFFSSCDVNTSDEFTQTFSYQISEKSVIQVDSMQRTAGQDSTITVQTFEVEPGDSTVFMFKHIETPPDNVLDGGFSEVMVFQIPADTNRFEFRKGDFTGIKAFYRRSCFCELPGAAFKVTNGFIRGERLSQVHWIVQADVTIESIVGNFRVKFNKPFYLN